MKLFWNIFLMLTIISFNSFGKQKCFLKNHTNLFFKTLDNLKNKKKKDFLMTYMNIHTHMENMTRFQ